MFCYVKSRDAGGTGAEGAAAPATGERDGAAKLLALASEEQQ